MIKKDSWMLGIAFGIILPLLLFVFFYFANIYSGDWFNNGRPLLTLPTIILISVFANMFTMRYFMLTKKYDKAGRGVLLVTFIYAGVFLYFHFNS